MLSIGEILNDTYRIEERIGAGGGGELFKAYHLRMKKYVAIKRIKEEIKDLVNIRAEVDLLKGLNNEHIPNVSDFIENGNDIYTVMDYIDGENMEQVYKKLDKPYSESVIKDYALQLCNAVKCIHNQNPPIIHSDIKPANVMKSADGKVYLIDFNISAIATGNVLSLGGSNGYSAPEQCKRMIKAPAAVSEFHEETRFLTSEETVLLDASVNYDVPLTGHSLTRSTSTQKTKNVEMAYIDTRTDIYGLGATMHYFLTNRKPVNGKTDFRGVRVSVEMQRIICKAMEQNPEKRYQKIEDMEAAIRNIGRHKKIIAGLAAAAAVIALTVGITIMVTGSESDNVSVPAVTTAASQQEVQTTVESAAAEEQLTTAATIPVEVSPDGLEINEATRKKWTDKLTSVAAKKLHNGYSDYSAYVEDFNSDGIPEIGFDGDFFSATEIYDIDNNLMYSFKYDNDSEYHFRKNADGKIEYLAETDFGDTEAFYFTGKTSEVSADNCHDKVRELVDVYADYAEFAANATEDELDRRFVIKDNIYAPDTSFIDLGRYYEWDQDSIDDAVAEILGVKSTLKTLTLNNNFSVQDEFSKICRIDGLEELTIYGDISGFEKISELKNLRKLTVIESAIDIKSLAGLTSLTELDLSGCNITDITPLAGLTSLTRLNLSWCDMKDLTPLSGLTSLKELNLTYCDGITDLTPLSGLTSLAKLDLTWCDNLTDFSPVEHLNAEIIYPGEIIDVDEFIIEETTDPSDEEFIQPDEIIDPPDEITLPPLEVSPSLYNEMPVFSHAAEGNIIDFGGKNWLVLERKEDRMLITSADIMELKEYHYDAAYVTWETCSLREYLNNDFYNSFSEAEKLLIIPTVLDNENNPKYKTGGGIATTDKIFIQSFSEMEKYFGTGEFAPETFEVDNTEKWLWLRDPGTKTNTAMGVFFPCLEYGNQNDIDSNYLNYYGCLVHYAVGIRPTMWIRT